MVLNAMYILQNISRRNWTGLYNSGMIGSMAASCSYPFAPIAICTYLDRSISRFVFYSICLLTMGYSKHARAPDRMKTN